MWKLLGEENPDACSNASTSSRSSSPGGSDVNEAEQGREQHDGSKGSLEARFRKRSSKAPGVEWMARVQDCQELRDERHTCSRQIVTTIEDQVRELEIEPNLRFRLVGLVENELDQCLQCLARKAYEATCGQWEQLQSMRQQASEMEEKFAQMNGRYLREISANRDKCRPWGEAVLRAADEAVDPNSAVEFYEPLQYMSTEMRSTTLNIVDEKLKAIFAKDPAVREKTNAQELAKFETSVLRDKVQSYEKLNSQLRNEARDLHARLKRSTGQCDKLHMELANLRREQRRQMDELQLLREAKERAEAAEKSTSELLCAAARRGKQAGPDGAVLIAHKRSVVSSCSSCSTGVQTCFSSEEWSDPQEQPQEESPQLRSPQASAQRLKLRSQPQLRLSLGEGSPNLLNQGSEEIAELHKLRRELQLARSLQQKRVEQIEALKAELSELRAAQAPASVDRRGSIKSRTSMLVEPSVCDGSATDVSATAAGALHAEPDEELGPAEEGRLEAQVAALEGQLQASMEMQQALHAELARVRAEAEAAQNEKLQWLRSQADSGEVAGAAELEAALRRNAELREETERLQAALSLLASRAAALEVRAANAEEPKFEPQTALAQGESTPAEHCLRHRLNVQKAQIAALVHDNQVLHLALESMQLEMQGLTRQLRQHVPGAEVVSADLESTLSKMEKVARNGGGAWIRLHKEAWLRDIARGVRPASPTVPAAAKPPAKSMPPLKLIQVPFERAATAANVTAAANVATARQVSPVDRTMVGANATTPRQVPQVPLGSGGKPPTPRMPAPKWTSLEAELPPVQQRFTPVMPAKRSPGAGVPNRHKALHRGKSWAPQ